MLGAENETVDVREGEALDAQVIDRAIKERVSGISGAPVVRQYPSGASNLTYAVDYPDRRLVLRRPPFGKLPKSGHDMAREYRIMSALKPVFLAVPTCLFLCEDESVIGAPFFVMDRVEGALLHAEIPQAWNWSRDETAALCANFWDMLVALHRVDIGDAGLADFGKPEGYIARQIEGWNGRYEKALTDDADRFDDVRGWLAAHMPADGDASVLHGDFRIDNCILDPGDPTRVVALLDWEICALGDPLMDLGNALAYWVEADDDPALKAFSMQPSFADGMMTRSEILDHYRRESGRAFDDFTFYFAAGLFRLAVIFQQIYYRSWHGQTDDPRFKAFGGFVSLFGNRARRAIETGAL